MGMDSHKHFLVGVFGHRGIKMLSVKTDLSITVRLEPLIPAYVECLWRQHQQCLPVFFKQLADRNLLFIVEFARLPFGLPKEPSVVLFNLRIMRHGHEQVGAVKVHLAFHVSLFPAE